MPNESNEQLRHALRAAGLEIGELADQIDVDPRTARRWLTGSTPYPRHRRRIADALGVSERVLWPDEVPDQEHSDSIAAETIEVHAAHAAPDWRELLTETRERAWLLDLTLADIIADGDGRLLADAAARGCQVRVLISDPDSVHLAIAEQDAGRHVDLTTRPACAADLERVARTLTPHPAIGLRSFVSAGSYRLLIFDDQALVRLLMPGVDMRTMPLLHLTRADSEQLFDRFREHFDALWQTGETPRSLATRA